MDHRRWLCMCEHRGRTRLIPCPCWACHSTLPICPSTRCVIDKDTSTLHERHCAPRAVLGLCAHNALPRNRGGSFLLVFSPPCLPVPYADTHASLHRFRNTNKRGCLLSGSCVGSVTVHTERHETTGPHHFPPHADCSAGGYCGVPSGTIRVC